jgi:hypothetical protein
MKLNSAVSKFLTNKWVLNIVAFLALFNVIGYIVMGNLNSVLYFIVFAVLIRYFSKNMTIILGVPLIIVNLLAIKGNVLEGMESGKTKPNKPENKQEQTNNIVKKNNPNNASVISDTSAAAAAANDDTSSGGEQQGFEPGRRKNKGNNIDYATTIEDAYDELNNILGSDGIQRLTSDTQNLMQQQMQLAEAMKGMAPMIKSLEPMVNNLQGMMGQLGDGKEGLGGIMDLAKKFSSQSAPVN